MIGSVQQIYIQNASSGTFRLNNTTSLPVGCSAKQMQVALEITYGKGNVVVFSSIGMNASDIPILKLTEYYQIVFIGLLWGKRVSNITVINNTDGQITVTFKVIGQRLMRLLRHTIDIYKLSSTKSLTPKDPEMSDISATPLPAYVGIPACYEPTPNFAKAGPPGLAKLENIMTADRWHFLSEVDIADRYIIVMRTPGNPLKNHFWTVQGNSFVNDSVPARLTQSQAVYAVLDPNGMITDANI